MRPATTFGWLVWRRARIAALFTFGSVLLTAAIANSPFAVYALPFGAVYFGLALIALLGTLALADGADIAGIDSAYPRYLFLLPLRSGALALWPMLFGSIGVATAWIGFAMIALAPRYGLVTVYLPASGLVAMLLSTQAVGWTPLPLPFLRVALCVAAPCVLAAWGGLGSVDGVAPHTLVLGYAACSVAAFLVAVRGLAIARAGRNVERSWRLGRPRVETESKPRRPFRSAMDAQVWLECAHDGLILPGLGIFLSLFFLIPLTRPEALPTATIGSVHFGPSLFVYLLPLVMLPFLSGFDGCCASVRDNFREDFSLIGFLAGRPMSDAAIVESKLRMAAWATLRCLAILLVGPGLLLLGPIEVNGSPMTVAAYAWSHATARGFGIGALLFGALFYLTWRGTICAMWLRLSHRPWIRNGVGVALPVIVVGIGLYLGVHQEKLPELLPIVQRWATTVLAFAAALKIGVALALVRRMRTLGLVSVRTATRWGWTCLGGGAAVFLALWALFPSPPPLQAALTIVLLLPLVRVQLAVLALHANRHR